MTPTIVSFFTPGNDGNYYGLHAARLRKECDSLGLKVWLKEMDFAGRPWIDVLRCKAGVIIEALRTLNTPVMWVDVDATVLRRPEFIEKKLEERPDIDFMAVPKPPGHSRPFFMGCSFWNCTQPAVAFAQTWSDEHAKEDSEELAFKKAFLAHRASMTWGELPPGYLAILGHETITTSCVVVHRLSTGDTKRAFFEKKRKEKAI